MLVTRIITALVALGVFVPALVWSPDPLWMWLCAGLSMWAAWEWGKLAGLPAPGALVFAAAVGAADAALVSLPAARPVLYWVDALLWIVVAPLLLRYAPKGPPGPPPWSRLLLGMLALPAVFMALVQLRGASLELLLATMVIVWISDSVAYFSGRALGRHKLAPSVSPGKTWEGVAGALLAVAVYAVALRFAYAAFPLSLGWTLPLFLLLAAAGIVGDLMESLLKRWAGVKDSGKSLPGHGGILDRVDALLPVLPLAALAYLYR